jgi:hypothetical protein
MQGGAVWTTLCNLLSDFCMYCSTASPIVQTLVSNSTIGSAAGILEPQQQQQQLSGLLLSFSKAALYASELPHTARVSLVSPEQPAPCSIPRMEAWVGSFRVLNSIMTAAGFKHMEQMQQEQQGDAALWQLLLVRVMFASSKQAAACAAALVKGQEIEDEAVALLQDCLDILACAAEYIRNVISRKAAAAAAGAAEAGAIRVLQQLQQQMEELCSALHDVVMLITQATRGAGGMDLGRIDVGKASADVQALAQELQQWCLAYSGHFGCKCCCNNPACINVAMSSEQTLVGGKKCVCSSCLSARFCSKECQVAM